MSEPLISVCIITYNSSATIVETLDSIKNQTYANVELIISDDFSRDNTTTIVENWISENKERFSVIKLIKADKNHGTAINLDTAIRNAHGDWIKILAGDDCLTPDCLSVFQDIADKKPGVFYVCDIEPFAEDGDVPLSLRKIYAWFFHCASLPLQQKIRNNLYRLQLAGPAYFFSREHYLSINPEQPEYAMLDEWPLILKTLLSGNDILPVEGKLVRYRVSAASLSHQNKSIGSKRIFNDNKLLFETFIQPELKKRYKMITVLDQKIHYSIREKQFTIFEETGKISTGIYRFYQLLPLSLFYKLKQQLWILLNYEKNAH